MFFRNGCVTVTIDIVLSDTDSMLFSIPNDDASRECLHRKFWIGSTAYGAWKEETDSKIVSYCSLGSKNYSYTTSDGKTIVKTRGFNLSSLKAKELINPQTMAELLTKYVAGKEDVILCPTFSMRIDRQKAQIRSTTVNKRYTNQNMTKRLVMPLYGYVETNPCVCTLPFGLRTTDYFNDCHREDVF